MSITAAQAGMQLSASLDQAAAAEVGNKANEFSTLIQYQQGLVENHCKTVKKAISSLTSLAPS